MEDIQIESTRTSNMAMPEMNEQPNVIKLFQDLQEMVNTIPSDLGGGSPLSKTLLMAYLFLEQKLKTYVEIGVYRGKSFIPMAYAARGTGGVAYGIDPYDLDAAKEVDLNGDLLEKVDQFLNSLDFSALYDEVEGYRERFRLVENSKLIKQTSHDAIQYFQKNHLSIDMLHVDGNHDTRFVLEDINIYFPFVKDGGFIVMDDINWDSVKPAYNYIKKYCQVIFDNGLFAILYKPNRPDDLFPKASKDRYKIIHGFIDNVETFNLMGERNIKDKFAFLPKVSVVVTAYKHEKYIAQCLEGIFAQKGEFMIELVIRDDCSPDSTLEVINNYIKVFNQKNIDLKILPSDQNLGVTKNLKKCLDACTGNYIAICEGDDFWIDCYKLQKQLDYMKIHPECSFCYNDILLLEQNTGKFSPYFDQNKFDHDQFSTSDLVRENFIGNFSCCFYDAQHLKKLSDNLFEMYVVDWMFNICYAEYGAIGHLKENLSVYRKHSGGAWSGLDTASIVKRLYSYINDYNRCLNYNYDAEFSFYQKKLYTIYPTLIQPQSYGIAVIDDVFPHPLSAFRLQEFVSYFHFFKNLCVYASGLSMKVLGKEPIDEIIANFKRNYPDFAQRIITLEPDSIIQAQLLYFVFLGNTYINMDLVDRLQIPFVFTLYPGGGFGLNNDRSDTMLKRVTSSPWFRKVIVTQRITYNYLLDNGFCTADQIELIFGVVMPLDRIPDDNLIKNRYGYEKANLDISFVAHKYTEKGIDKGYDVFIDLAKIMCAKYDNVHFHVVGGFDESVIDVTEIKDRITFYGNQDIAWFNGFYKNIDLIISPNLASVIYNGSFDGFPTGCCVDAGLRQTAVLCTDELGMNTYFVDGEEIVIIPHDLSQIVKIVENLLHDPETLKRIGVKGAKAFKRLYSYEAQVDSRIKILNDEYEHAEENKIRILREIEQKRETTEQMQPTSEGSLRNRFILLFLDFVHVVKKITPKWMKRLFNVFINSIIANHAIYSFLNRWIPSSIKRLYLRIRMKP